jgi:hypothetical protein
MNKAGNMLLLHQLEQPATKIAVDRQIILIVQQRHVRHTSTIDDGIAPLGSLSKVGIIQKRPSENAKGLQLRKIGDMKTRRTPQQGMYFMTLLQKLFQNVMSQQSVAA